ncbi:MAG: hypothetical protein J4F37_04410 [Acidobacteria bacterium]|nr:hypothetical protein [Acidobacteriota bacterium]
MIQENNRDCYTDDWKRTEPDHVVYLPTTEHQGKRVFWYPDRKHFLLGKVISDEFLADVRVPA